jgi:hypothetical protein
MPRDPTTWGEVSSAATSEGSTSDAGPSSVPQVSASVVDGEPTLVRVVSAHLGREAFDVTTTAADGTEALRLAREMRPAPTGPAPPHRALSRPVSRSANRNGSLTCRPAAVLPVVRPAGRPSGVPRRSDPARIWPGHKEGPLERGPDLRFYCAPSTGLEPVTVRLTVGCSAN